jgi:hypothetical protein
MLDGILFRCVHVLIYKDTYRYTYTYICILTDYTDRHVYIYISGILVRLPA